MSRIPTVTFRDPSPDGSLPFEIVTFEDMHPLAQTQLPHRIYFYETLYITAGVGDHIIDFEVYPLNPPSIFFLSPGQVHFYQRKTPLDGYGILFTEDFLLSMFGERDTFDTSDFFHSVQQNPVLRVQPDEVLLVLPLIEEIYAEYASDSDFRVTTLQAYLHILLVKFHRLLTAKNQISTPIPFQSTQSLVQKFKRLVSQHYLLERSVQFYAGQLGFSLSHLAAIVKDVTGETPGHFIRKNVALEAKRLLVHTDQTVEQVSYQLHFKDPSYFGRFFKREVGVSPKAFRDDIREKYQIVRNL